MKGKELIQFLGYTANHPEFIAFLQAHGVSIKQLPDPQTPAKKGQSTLIKTFKQGFILNFDCDTHHPVKNPIENNPIYLTSINFFKPAPADAAAFPPVQLPFGLQFLDSTQILTAKFGDKNIHGTNNSPYYEADESDYFYESYLNTYHITVYFDRGDLQEKLQELRIMLK